MSDESEAAVSEQYNRDGYLIHGTPLFPREIVEAAVAGMDAIRAGDYDTGRPPESSPWKPGDDPGKLCKIEQPQFASKAVMELIRFPALGELAAAITGATMVQAWWVQLLYKPSTQRTDSGTHIGMHQDRTYWGQWEPDSELFTAWVALSDVEDDSGPMRFVRGSHRWGLCEGGDFFEQDVNEQRHNMKLPPGEEWTEVPAILPAGGLSFHHNLTIHGSGANHSGRPRRSFAIHLRTQNSRTAGDRREGLTTYIDDTSLCPVIYSRG